MIIGYARVSTTEQNLDLQRDALKRAGCEKIIEDTVSGGKVQRPGLERVHDALRSGDVLAVWRLDRLGRSLKHLIELMAELESERVGFQSVTESIDTTTPGGKLVFHIFGALAEFERNLIRERTYAGLAAARRGVGRAAGEKSSVRNNVPWRSICTGRRNIQLTKSAKRLASRGRRSTSMSRRRLATDDDRSVAAGVASVHLAGCRFHVGATRRLLNYLSRIFGGGRPGYYSGLNRLDRNRSRDAGQATCLLSRGFVSYRRLEVSHRIRGKGLTQLRLTNNL